jgi:hypothetical protein
MNTSPAAIGSSSPSPLDQRLRSYSLAAGAAGVTLLALASPAQAEIVYTPAHAKLTSTGQFPIDFNHDGVVDFLILNKSSYKTGSCSFCAQNLNVSGNGNAGAAVLGHEVVGQRGDALPLKAGAVIGPADNFLDAQTDQILMASAFNDNNSFLRIYGKFPNTKDRYLGLKFEINGAVHYGWARFVAVRAGFVGSSPFVWAAIDGYAYETVPNQPIVAGKTQDAAASNPDSAVSRSIPQGATLGLLAMGSPALSAWRRVEA